tara:strand:- start:3473 stop:3871 length:399 start_codon:yes stop_codon:yes gene_type:complete
MNYKERMIDTATTILAEMYDIPETQLRTIGSRKRHIMEARRMFIFYLNKYIRIKHIHMKQYVKGLCHATSIHHCNKMEFFLVQEPNVAEEYKEFLLRMREFDVFNEVIKDKQQRVIELQAEINTYLKTTKND